MSGLLRKMFTAALLVGATVVLTGMGSFVRDPIIDEINKRVSPSTEWHQRALQTQTSIDEINTTSSWDAYLGINKSMTIRIIESVVDSSKSEFERNHISIRSTEIDLDDQAITIQATVSANWSDPSLEIEGRIGGIVAPVAKGPAVELRAAFTQVRLTKLKWNSARPTDLSVAIPIVQLTLDRLIGNINELIKPVTVPIAFSPFEPISPVSISTRDLKVEGSTLQVPQPSILNAVFFVDQAGIRVLVDLGLPGDTPRSAVIVPAVDSHISEDSFRNLHQTLKKSFMSTVSSAFGPGLFDFGPAFRIGILRRFIADALNFSTKNLDWTLRIDPSPVQQDFSSEVRLFNVPDPQNCQQKEDNRECSPHQCTRNHDNRECNTCLIHNPFGGCIQYGNDPFCEAQKAAQNVAYGTQFTTCLADAARRKGECEVAKATQNGLYATEVELCRKGNEIIRSLANFGGRVGSVSGTISADAVGSIRLNKLHVSPTLETVNIDVVAEGNAKINARISFVPSDFAGNLLCQFPFQNKPISASAMIGPQRTIMSGRINSGKGRVLNIETSDFEIAFQVRPRPVEALFGQNPDLNITCAGAAALAWLGGGLRALGVNDLPSAFTGDFNQKVGTQTIPIQVPIVEVTLPGRHMLSLVPILRTAGVEFEGNEVK